MIKDVKDRPNLVGDTMMAATWCRFTDSSNRSSRSTTGIRNERVLPLPVTAYDIQHTIKAFMKSFLPYLYDLSTTTIIVSFHE